MAEFMNRDANKDGDLQFCHPNQEFWLTKVLASRPAAPQVETEGQPRHSHNAGNHFGGLTCSISGQAVGARLTRVGNRRHYLMSREGHQTGHTDQNAYESGGKMCKS